MSASAREEDLDSTVVVGGRPAVPLSCVCAQVACFGSSKHEAFLKALISTGAELPLVRRSILVSAGT